MSNLYFLITTRLFLSLSDIGIMNWISNLFESHIFKSEYVKLLEIGSLIGCLLAVSLIFLVNYSKIVRADYLKKHMILHLKAGLILGTIAALILIISRGGVGYVILVFISYLIFSAGINKMREYYFDKEHPKGKYKKQII